MGMGYSSILILLFCATLNTLHSATVVVDGVSEWKNPHLQIGDSVIFKHKFHYNLYIFKNQQAFSLCNFSQATILTNPTSSVYTWHTSRVGFFYFSFYNGSNASCLRGQKLAVKVTRPALASAPEAPPQLVAPSPSSGGVVASSPAFPWPFKPRDGGSPGPAPDGGGGATSPVAPEKEGIPFINSNPAVPLPTGEVDSATIRPFPTSGFQQVVGFTRLQKALISSSLILLMMIVQ